jgi:hypothetical protein
MNNGLCKYKNMFGAPSQGIHQYRLFNVAIIDVIATFLLAYLLTFIIKWNIFILTAILILISIPIHQLFCVNTTLTAMTNRLLGSNVN